MMVLYCRYAGMPYLSLDHYKGMKHVGIVVAYWSVAYIIKLTTVHFNSFNPSIGPQDTTFKGKEVDLGTAILNFSLCVGCDLVPFMLVIDSHFIQILTFDLIRKHKSNEDAHEDIEHAIKMKK